MFALSHTVQVNPLGAERTLTCEQVWRGLVMKAENALPFVKAMSRCEVVERSGNTILRDITVQGSNHRERITLFEPVQVHFERLDEAGFIENTISQSDFGLLLTFTFGLNFPEVEPGSAEEREKGNGMRQSYVDAVTSTLSRVRQMVAEGAL